MRWRLQANGYASSQAWWRETAWVYGLGLFGFALYSLIVVALWSLGAPLQIHWVVLHCLAWGFFVVAHLPDLIESDDLEGVGGHRDPGRRFRGWNLMAALIIAGINITAAFTTPDLLVRAQSHFPRVDLTVLNLAVQGAVIVFATLVHGLVNGITCVMHRLSCGLAEARTGPPPVTPGLRPARDVSRVAEPDVEENSQADLPGSPHRASESAFVPRAAVRQAPAALGENVPESHPVQSGTDEVVEESAELPKSSLAFRHRRNPEPLKRLLEYLTTLRPEEVRPTLRILSAMAAGNPEWLNTPALLHRYKDHLFHPDGSINAVVLSRSLKVASRAHSFYPASKLGTSVYRPLARRLHRALRGVATPEFRPWLSTQSKAVQRCADLILGAPSDLPVVVTCVCSRNVHRSRTMKKVLDHLIGRNGLGHVALTFSGGVDLEPGEAWALWDPALHRILRKQNSVLRRLGVQELDWAPRCASDPWLTSATVVLVADTAVEAVLRRRFATLISNDAGGRDKIVLFAALDPHRYREAHDLPDPDQSRITVGASAFNILTVMTERILPILFQRAGSLDAALPWRLRALEPPSSLAEHRSVANFRKVVGALEGQLRDSKSPEALDRLLKLVWALAYRDASMLLLSGLPNALREQARVSTDLDDATLWNCLRNLAWLDSVIPGNRAKDYARIARLLGKAGAATRPTSAGDDPETTAMSCTSGQESFD